MSTSCPTGRALDRGVEQQVEVLEAGGGARLQRARRDGMDADLLLAEFEGEVAAGGFSAAFTGPITL